MAYENRPGQGVMFPRDKQGNPNRPDYTGTVNVAGHEYEISGWEKVARSGNRYISVEVREPFQPGQQQGQNQQAPQYAPQQRPAYQQPQRPAPVQQTYQQPAPAPAPQYAPETPADLPF